MYCHRRLLAQELRKSHLGLAALPDRDAPQPVEAGIGAKGVGCLIAG